MRTEVVNLTRGDPYDVYIGREGKGLPGIFGNYVEEGQNRYERVAAFREAFYKRIIEDDVYRFQIDSLRGKRIACFCFPLLCHGCVFVEYLENISADQQIAEYIDSRIRKPPRRKPSYRKRPIEPDMFEGL
jgi:hypothetical protein